MTDDIELLCFVSKTKKALLEISNVDRMAEVPSRPPESVWRLGLLKENQLKDWIELIHAFSYFVVAVTALIKVINK